MSVFADKKRLMHYACALLMVALLVLQFTPYWRFGEEPVIEASIAGLTWFPENQLKLLPQLDLVKKDLTLMNSVVYVPVLLFLLGLGGVAACVVGSESRLACIPGILFGILGLLGYLLTPALRMGGPCYLHVALCAAVLAVSALTLFTYKK